MAGITRIGTHVPVFRLGPATKDWSGQAERTVANFDEDAITMAVAAVRDCLRGQDHKVDAIYFASTTSPYEEKQAAPLVAIASDLPDDIFTTDVGHSLRAGTIALQMAADAVNTGRIQRAVVVVSDARLGLPGSDFEKFTGDGAVAFLIESAAGLATIDGSAAVSNEVHDTWRPAGQRTVQSWEERFVQEEGYLDSLTRLGQRLDGLGKPVGGFNRVALYGTNLRRQAEGQRALGITAEQLVPSLFDRMGNTGAAFMPMLLASALETATSGQSLLLVNYGDGADALWLTAQAGVAAYQGAQDQLKISGGLASKMLVPDYAEYLRWRGLLEGDSGVRRPSGSGPSSAALHREREEVLQFHGVRCKACGTIQYPPQRICIECQKMDTEPQPLADERARLFTYSMDYIAGTMDVPLVLCVIDFEIGARAVLMMTDREVEQIAIDMPLRLAFRQARSGGGIPNYYWKCLPERVATS